MDNIDLHQKYLKKRFDIKLIDRSYFTTEQTEYLEKYGAWMNALATGVISPTTDSQLRFIEVAKGLLDPITAHEHAWMKLQARKNDRIAAENLRRENAEKGRTSKVQSEVTTNEQKTEGISEMSLKEYADLLLVRDNERNMPVLSHHAQIRLAERYNIKSDEMILNFRFQLSKLRNNPNVTFVGTLKDGEVYDVVTKTPLPELKSGPAYRMVRAIIKDNTIVTVIPVTVR